MMTSDLVSVVIPVYNSEKYLEECLNSIISQTYQNIEIIVIDDGSSDNSVRVVESYLPKVSLIKQKNLGVSAARNRGIEASKGELLVFLDSDDWLSNDIIEQHVKTFKEYENIEYLKKTIENYFFKKFHKTAHTINQSIVRKTHENNCFSD